MKTIAVIGGGFCGTTVTVNLARLGTEAMRVILINAWHGMGRGVAYGTLRPEHLLNVVARNMSAFPDLPSHFVDWLRTRADFAQMPLTELREMFAPRRVYGDYLQGLLFAHTDCISPTKRVRVETIDDEAIDVIPSGEGVRIVLKAGEAIEADRAVIATGNLAPQGIPCSEAIKDHAAYCANPWGDWYRKLPDARENILLVGTSLTMIDAFLTLQEMNWRGTITAVSRNGLLPQSHFQSQRDPAIAMGEPWTLSLSALVTWIESQCTQLREEGLNPAIIVDKLRPFTQQVWRHFTLEDKKQFCERYRSRWGVARHRIAPEVAGRIENACKTGSLRILRGTIRDLRTDGQRIRATIEPGHGQPQHELTVGLLMNCTGPRERFSNAPEPPFRNLFQRGLVSPDELDLGINVAPNFALVDREGTPSSVLFAFGPLLRGTLWETTAVPELRSQAFHLAQTILAEETKPYRRWMPDTPADLLEYQI